MLRALIVTITAIITLCVLQADGVSAHPAWSIVIDRNNQIYFSDIETIWKIDAKGKLSWKDSATHKRLQRTRR